MQRNCMSFQKGRQPPPNVLKMHHAQMVSTAGGYWCLQYMSQGLGADLVPLRLPPLFGETQGRGAIRGVTQVPTSSLNEPLWRHIPFATPFRPSCSTINVAEPM